MTATLADLVDVDEMQRMIDAGYVRLQRHPQLPLTIANYTEKAQYENAWNGTTLTCRGLIYDDRTRIIARPFRKFFNYGDDDRTGPLHMTEPVIVTDKLDGSLGISYPTPDGPAVATRGSFTSDQAVHATELLRRRYPHFKPLHDFTYLWEIVYPQNRIVVDYGDTDDLILLALVHITSGTISSTDYGWPGPTAHRFEYATLTEALAAEPRPGKEGLVVRYAEQRSGPRMVKVKQADYVALHRIVTGLNARTVWEWLGDGKTVGDLCATVPDDFHGWIEHIAAELYTAQRGTIDAAQAIHATASAELDETRGAGQWDRGDYARHTSSIDKGIRPYLFLLLDDNHDRAADLAWRQAKPSGARSMVNHTEAIA